MFYFNPQNNILNPTGFLIYGRSDEGQLDVSTEIYFAVIQVTGTS